MPFHILTAKCGLASYLRPRLTNPATVPYPHTSLVCRYDYLMGDIPHWRRVVWLHLPLQFLGACAVTVGLGLLIKNDSAASRQIGALSAPVSAFSLLTSLILTVSALRLALQSAVLWQLKRYANVLKDLSSRSLHRTCSCEFPHAEKHALPCLCALTTCRPQFRHSVAYSRFWDGTRSLHSAAQALHPRTTITPLQDVRTSGSRISHLMLIHWL